MSKFLDRVYLTIACISGLILIGGTMIIFESVANHISKIIFSDALNVIGAIIYIASCVHCYLLLRNDKKNHDMWHQGWVGRQLKRVQIKIEKNGQVVLDTTKKLSYLDEMNFYDKSDLVSYLLRD